MSKMIVEGRPMEMDERPNTHAQNQVMIYESGEALMKVETGTTLRVVKQLYSKQRPTPCEVLGVRQHQSDAQQGIPCIITLDDTALNALAYDILLADEREKDETEPSRPAQVNQRCVECCKEKWRMKSYVNTAVNTECHREYPNKESPPRGSPRSDDERRPQEPTHPTVDNNNNHYRNKEYRYHLSEQRNLQIYPPSYRMTSPTGRVKSPTYGLRVDVENHIGRYHHNRVSSPPSRYRPGLKLCERDMLPPSHHLVDRDLYHQHHQRIQQWRYLEHYKKKFQHSYEESLMKLKKSAQDAARAPPVSTTDVSQHPSPAQEAPPVYVLPNDYDEAKSSSANNTTTESRRSPTFSSAPSQVVKQESRVSPPSGIENIYPHHQNASATEGGDPSPTNASSGKGGLLCKICNELFPTKSLLYKHLRGHTSDEKPFKCNECGQGFTLSSNLRQHRIIHRGYKPFQCEFCGKKFMRSNVYKQHRRIHTGEKMHKCQLCPSEFLQKYAMIKHMKKNHDIDAME